jgi:hypothetical protein
MSIRNAAWQIAWVCSLHTPWGCKRGEHIFRRNGRQKYTISGKSAANCLIIYRSVPPPGKIRPPEIPVPRPKEHANRSDDHPQGTAGMAHIIRQYTDFQNIE